MMPRWAVLCAALLAVTSTVATAVGWSLSSWLHTQWGPTPMTLPELTGLATIWGVLLIVPWTGLVGAVSTTGLWPRWQKAAFCLAPMQIIMVAAVLSLLPTLGLLVCIAAALGFLAWMIGSGVARARMSVAQRN